MKIQRNLLVWFGLFAFLCASLLWTGCSTAPDPWKEAPGEGKHVLVSFPPLYCFARNVAGEHAKVLSLISTVGPHDYSPTTHDALKANAADLILVNGLGLDEWITVVKNSTGNQELKVVEVGESLPDKKLLKIGEHEHEHEEEAHGHHHHHGEYDPHAWLGIDEAILMLEKIRDELSTLDPAHKEAFRKNADKYIGELKKLHEYGKEKFAMKKNKRIIATHDSLRYFARSFGLDVVAHIMPQPGVEADANKLKQLVDIMNDKKHPVRIITVEPQYSKATAETLYGQVKRQQPDAQLVEFDTIETAPSRSELTKDLYINVMKDNINRLAKAMK